MSTEFYDISEEMLKKLEEIDNAGKVKIPLFTKEQEEIILKFYPLKNKDQLAELLGVHVTTLRKHYQRLIRNAKAQK